MEPRILVIRGGALGDFILTLPGIALLRREFPGAHLEIMGYPHIAELALGTHADGIRSIEYAPMARFFVPGAELDPDLMAYFGSFQQVISYLFDPDGLFEENLRRCGVKQLICGSPKVSGDEHAAHALARPLESMALYLEDPAARIEPETNKEPLWPDHDAGRQVVAVHPGSGNALKNWPAERWAEIGRWLIGEGFAARLLLVGGHADEAELDFLRRAWSDLPVTQAVNLPLRELAAGLSKCALYMGHDTGVSHLAAATGVKCLLFFGHTEPSVWAPRNDGVTVLESSNNLLRDIPLSEVRNHAATLLA